MWPGQELEKQSTELSFALGGAQRKMQTDEVRREEGAATGKNGGD